MRKLLFLTVCTLLKCTCLVAADRVQLVAKPIDYVPLGHSHTKHPIYPPQLFIDDHTLSFSEGHADYVLNVKNEDGDIVFTTLVYSAQTEVSLPATLTGDYEVELVMGNWKFTGYITLL